MKKFQDIADAPAEQICAACECSKPTNAFWPGARRCKQCILTVSAAEAEERDRRNAERKAVAPPKRRGRKPAVMAAPGMFCPPAVTTLTKSANAKKKCKGCRVTKPIEGFDLHPRGTHGRRATCKPCVAEGKGERKTTPEQRARYAQLNRKPDAVAKQRAAAARWRAENPAATRAMDRLNAAIRKGLVVRSPCCQVAGCGATSNVVGHHYDYVASLEVAWLCKTHHRRLHNGTELELIEGLPAHLLGIPQTYTATNRPAPRMTCDAVAARKR